MRIEELAERVAAAVLELVEYEDFQFPIRATLTDAKGSVLVGNYRQGLRGELSYASTIPAAKTGNVEDWAEPVEVVFVSPAGRAAKLVAENGGFKLDTVA